MGFLNFPFPFGSKSEFPLCQVITPKRVKNKAVAVAQLGRSYPQGGDKLNKKRLANKKL